MRMWRLEYSFPGPTLNHQPADESVKSSAYGTNEGRGVEDGQEERKRRRWNNPPQRIWALHGPLHGADSYGTQAQDALRQDASGGGREAHQSQGEQGRRASI